MRIGAMKKQSQNKPNLLNAQMNISSVLTKDYENERLCRRGENKPNQTQTKLSWPIGHKEDDFVIFFRREGLF